MLSDDETNEKQQPIASKHNGQSNNEPEYGHANVRAYNNDLASSSSNSSSSASSGKSKKATGGKAGSNAMQLSIRQARCANANMPEQGGTFTYGKATWEVLDAGLEAPVDEKGMFEFGAINPTHYFSCKCIHQGSSKRHVLGDEETFVMNSTRQPYPLSVRNSREIEAALGDGPERLNTAMAHKNRRKTTGPDPHEYFIIPMSLYKCRMKRGSKSKNATDVTQSPTANRRQRTSPPSSSSVANILPTTQRDIFIEAVKTWLKMKPSPEDVIVKLDVASREWEQFANVSADVGFNEVCKKRKTAVVMQEVERFILLNDTARKLVVDYMDAQQPSSSSS